MGSEKQCMGCRKDYFLGQYVFCNGIFPTGYVKDCAFVGGPGRCSFPSNKDITMDQCEALCAEEPGCEHFSWLSNNSCRLHLMPECYQLPSSKSFLAAFDAERCFVGSDVVIEENNGTDATQSPTSSVTDECRASEMATGFACDGCRKDLASGQYIGCDGVTDTNATKTDCEAVGGEGGCTFGPQNMIGLETCEAMCRFEEGCKYFSWWYSGDCVLHLTQECTALVETTSPLVTLLRMPTASHCAEDESSVGIGGGGFDDDEEELDPTDPVFDEPTSKPTKAPTVREVRRRLGSGSNTGA
jgi:hypothetical protein